jgi:mannose-6-phosphate isomerase-like protein (cupin superfamily)
MTAFDLQVLLQEQRALGTRYLEFLRVPALSMGVYRLEAGGVDQQKPHAEDEVYLVMEGKARFEAKGEDVAVEPGRLLFVPAQVPHRFHDITQDLVLLVFFAPAESPGVPAP